MPGPAPRRRRFGNRHDTFALLNFAEQAAALQIRDVFQALTSSLQTRAAMWEAGRVDCARSDDVSERLAELYAGKFLPWARWMADPASAFVLCRSCGRLRAVAWQVSACSCGSRRVRNEQPHLPLVLSIIVFGAGLEQCAGVYRMRRERVLRLLRAGMQRYVDFA